MMAYYLKLARALCRDCRGVTALEYAIIAGIIVATILIGFTSLSNALSGKFNTIGGSL
jgi:Flp pilus assembly pilin Flp